MPRSKSNYEAHIVTISYVSYFVESFWFAIKKLKNAGVDTCVLIIISKYKHL